MGTAGMKNAGLVVLALAVLVMGWRLVEVTREQTSIEEQARTRSGELQVQLEASGDALEQVQRTHDKAVERMQELEAELVQERAGRAAAVEAEEAIFAKYAELENALAERRASDKQREGRLQTLRATHEELASERDGLMAERDRFATELQSARSISSAENTRLSAELRKAHSRVDQLVAERDDLRTRAVELENAGDGTRDELARVRKSLTKERDGAAALSVQLTHERTEKSRIEQENRELLAKFDTIEHKQSDSRAEFEAMANERRRLALRLNELEGTTAALRRTASTAAGELGRAQSMAADLNTRYEKLLTEKATLNHLNEARLTEIERIRVALEDAQRDVARLTNAHGIYTIKEGGSLSTVAAFFYANGNYWPRIAEANRFLIGDNPDLIFAGMVLIIP